MHHGRRFCADDAHFGNERCGGASLHQTDSVRPLHGIQRPGRHLVHIGEARQRIGVRHIDLMVLRIAVQDRCHLLTGDGIVRAELLGAVTFHDLCRLRPADRFGIPLFGLHIVKAHGVINDRLALQTPQHRDDHGAGSIGLRCKFRIGNALHQALFHDVVNVIIAPCRGSNIGEREHGINRLNRSFLDPLCVNGLIAGELDLVNGRGQCLIAVPTVEVVAILYRNVLIKVEILP